MNRKQERENTYLLLFEREFNKERDPAEILTTAAQERGIELTPYTQQVFSGVCGQEQDLEALIADHARAWKTNRISKASMAAMKLACYEMRNLADVPPRVAVNEAVELTKKYAEERAYVFVNGVLNAVMQETEQPS